MPSAEYTFRINKFHCNGKISNGNYADNDYAIFSISLNGDVYAAPACTPPSGTGSPTAGVLDVVFNGDDVLLWDKQPEDDSWQIGPITIDDEDIVVVFYLITNLSYRNPAAQTAEALKIASGAIAALGALLAISGGIGAIVGAPLSTIPGAIVAIVGGVIALIGAVIGLIGEIVGALGANRPNCDSPLFASPTLVFPGVQLEALIQDPGVAPGIFTHTFVDTNLTNSQPKGCWTPSTDITWSISKNIQSALTGGGNPPQQMSMRMLAASQGPQNWDGKWGDGQYWEDSRIQCSIISSGTGPSGATAIDRTKSYTAGLLHSLQTEPMTLKLLGTPVRAVRSSGLTIVALPPALMLIPGGLDSAVPLSARYAANIVERFGAAEGAIAAQLTVENLIEIPMQAEPFTSDIYAQDVLRPGTAPLSGTGLLNTGINEPIASSGTGTLNPIVPPIIRVPIGITPRPAPLPIAATLVASAQSSLELFAEIDQSKQIVGYRVRYVRTDANGVVLTDVMLSPVQNMAR